MNENETQWFIQPDPPPPTLGPVVYLSDGDREQVRVLPDGGHNKDGTLTLSPTAARLLMEQINYRGLEFLKCKGFINFLDDMTDALHAQGLEWEQKT